jgi:predicted ester cyclase
MTTLISENNKAIARRFLQLVSEKNFDELCQVITPTWTMYGGLPNLPQGSAGMRELCKHLSTIQQVWTITDIIAEGDKVVVRATNTCTQDDCFGVPVKDKQQIFTAMFMFKIVDGKIEEIFRNADDLGRIFQLGGKVTLCSDN